jgi:hypothetical protein
MMQSRLLIGVAVASVALASTATAYGKGSDPIHIVAESGKVGWIRGAAAKMWWADFAKGQPADCTCNSPDAAAKFLTRLTGRWRGLGGGWPMGMLVQAGGHAPFDAPMVYYPASGTAPPYLVIPGGLGGGRRTWDDWRVVTPRMQRLMTVALKKGTVTTYTGSTSFPTGWLVGGGLGAVLLAGLILATRRQPRLFKRLVVRLPDFRHRLSP